MFDGDIRLVGKHARILKKYSVSKQGENQVPFMVTDVDGKSHEISLFGTMMQTYLVGCALGIEAKKRSVIDTNQDEKANIFAEMVVKNRPTFYRLLQVMILTEENELSVNQKIKNSFSVNTINDPNLENRLKEYALAGLEILDSYFCECKSEEVVVNALLCLNENYSLEE